MTQLIDTLDTIAADYDVLFCDLWGCVHDGEALYPAAVAALQRFRAGGGAVVLMTNAPRTHGAVERRLVQMGMPRDAWDLIAASGDATQEALLMGVAGQNIWHLGPTKDDDLFIEIPDHLRDRPPITRVDFDAAEGILCTGPFHEDTETPEDYRGRLLSAKVRGLPMLSANPDLVVDVGPRRIYCGGAIAALYEEMGGRVMTFGKPHPPIYDLARRKLAANGIDSDRVLALGDGWRTDLAGAAGEGIDALFITGGLETEHFGPDPERPDPGALTAWLDNMNLTPRYAIGRLR